MINVMAERPMNLLLQLRFRYHPRQNGDDDNSLRDRLLLQRSYH